MAKPDPTKILNTLQELCTAKVPLALMSRDLLVVCHGRFSELSQDALTLQFDARPTGLGFLPPAFCIGSFNHEARPHLFTTRIKRNPEPNGPGPYLVEVEVPGAMRWPESRMAVRLPVPQHVPLQVRVQTATSECTAIARDISLCGALISLHGTTPPILGAGERVVVDLALGQQSVRLPAIVRRRDPPRYGLYFPDSVTEGRLDPPLMWRQLVDSVAHHG